jgi:tetratricopeptide (TPR) repeat protein
MALLASLCLNALKSQDFNALVNAFDSSYTYEIKEKYDRAAAVLKKYYDPGSYEINIRLGYLEYMAGSYAESLKYYQKAIELKPFAIEPRLGFVLPASALGNTSQVAEQYKKILEVDPMNTTANYFMGLILFNQEQYDQALKYFEKVANMYPFDYDTIIMYAWTHYRLGNFREARVLFEKALLIKPEDDSATEGLHMVK